MHQSLAPNQIAFSLWRWNEEERQPLNFNDYATHSGSVIFLFGLKAVFELWYGKIWRFETENRLVFFLNVIWKYLGPSLILIFGTPNDRKSEIPSFIKSKIKKSNPEMLKEK